MWEICTLGYHVLICNLLDVWMDQLTPEKKFNSNLEEEGKKGEEAFVNII